MDTNLTPPDETSAVEDNEIIIIKRNITSEKEVTGHSCALDLLSELASKHPPIQDIPHPLIVLTQSQRTKIQQLKLSEILQIKFPRKYNQSIKDDNTNINMKNSTISRVVNDVRSILSVLSYGDSTFMEIIIKRYIESTPTLEYNDSIVTSINEYLQSNDRKKNLTTEASNARNAVIEACMYNRSHSMKRICNVLGIDYSRTVRRLSNTNNRGLTNFSNSKYVMTKRAQKSVIMSKVINKYLHSDLGSYFPLKIQKICVGKDVNMEQINHPLRVMVHATIKKSHEAFKRSDAYKVYETTNGDNISYNFFRKNICPCIKKPTFENCVDLIASAIHYKQRAVFNALTKSSILCRAVSDCTCIMHSDALIGTAVTNLFSVHWKDLLDKTCCAKVPFPSLSYKEGNETIIPKLSPPHCVLGSCENCGVMDKLTLDRCPVFSSNK